MAKAYEALIFDLVDTLVVFDRQRLPAYPINGQEVRTSSGRVFEHFRPHYPALTPEEFHEAFLASGREAERRRGLDLREIRSQERFRFLLDKLGIQRTPESERLADEGVLVHMRTMAAIMEIPPAHRDFLAWAHGRYRLAVLSNFDFTPTVHWVLEREGVKDLFEEITVSADVGWRKPLAMIFHHTLGRLGLDAGQTLFVGDLLDVDVGGALAVGMDAVWVNPGGKRRTEDDPVPTHEVASLSALRAVLERPEVSPTPHPPSPDPRP